MIGKKLGQFHTDFDFECSYHIVDGKLLRVGDSIESKGEIHACQSIFLGKKSYIDRLQDEEGNDPFMVGWKQATGNLKMQRVQEPPVGMEGEKINEEYV